MIRHISDRVAVMYLGQIIEQATARVLYSPAHPYTGGPAKRLDPLPRTQRTRERIVLAGDPPDPSRIPPGCRFHTRCPYVMEICRTVVPLPTPVVGSGEVACHLHTTGPLLNGGSVRHLRTGATRTPDAPDDSESGATVTTELHTPADKMRSAVWQGIRSISLTEVDVPDPGPRDVVVDIAACGICGSDVHRYAEGAWAAAGMPMGHEFSGTVSAVGAEVDGLAVGDRVAVNPAAPCGVCARPTRTNLCADNSASALGG